MLVLFCIARLLTAFIFLFVTSHLHKNRVQVQGPLTRGAQSLLLCILDHSENPGGEFKGLTMFSLTPLKIKVRYRWNCTGTETSLFNNNNFHLLLE